MEYSSMFEDWWLKNKTTFRIVVSMEEMGIIKSLVAKAFEDGYTDGYRSGYDEA